MELKFHNSGYCSACSQYSDCLHRAQLLMQELFQTKLRCSYVEVIVTNMLRLSSRTVWPLRNIHISNDNGSFTSNIRFFFLFSITDNTITGLDYIYEQHGGCLIKTRTASPSRAPGFCFGGVRVGHRFVFYVVFCLSSSCILCAQCSEFLDCPFLITPSVFSDVYIMAPVNHIRLLFTSLNLALIWQLFYLFCSSIVVNTVIVTAGNFEP